jgi:outer membrane protein TolC
MQSLRVSGAQSQRAVDDAIAQRDESAARLAAAEQVVIGALTDVEQAMLARQASRQSLQLQAAGLADAQRVVGNEQSRYTAGDSTLAQLLQARLAYEDVLADELQARGDVLLAYVRLQKSLAGPL